MKRPLLSMVALLLAVIAAPQGARPEVRCPVPDNLALHDLSLPAARRAVAGGALTVLVVGGAASQGAMAGDAAHTMPGRLEAELAAALPHARVRVVNGAQPRTTAETHVQRMYRLLGDSGAHLVIWSTGAREAVLGLDVDPFITALQSGIELVHKAGADLILLDMQYAPSIARIANLEPFREALAGTAAANDIPLLPRYELMMHWNDEGLLNLDAQDNAERQAVARRLFSCLATSLSEPIVAAVR